jgi:hypothetical protein
MPMVPDPQHRNEYREWAAECLRLAQTEADEATRVRFLTMAQRWLDLAEGRHESEEFDRLLAEFNDRQMLPH